MKAQIKKLTGLAIITLFSIHVFAQSSNKQDIGINFAGLIVKNQPTVASALMYKYRIGKNFQLRLQLALDANLDSKNRTGNFNNGGSFGSFSQDTILKFDPGKNVRYGLMAGIQRNIEINNSNFSAYYGLDLIFMMNDFYQSGKGQILQGNGGFDTTKQRINLKVSDKNKMKIYGIGIPIGITYRFGKRFYTSLEAKFVIVYQKGKTYNLVETSQISQFQEFTTKVESESDIKGFDFGIKPLTGLCIGLIF